MVILLSVVINLYQVLFFVHGYMRSSQIQIFIGNQLKRSQTKQVLKLHMLCNYVLKENSNEAFPKSRCCSAIILSCLTSWTRLLYVVLTSEFWEFVPTMYIKIRSFCRWLHHWFDWYETDGVRRNQWLITWPSQSHLSSCCICHIQNSTTIFFCKKNLLVHSITDFHCFPFVTVWKWFCLLNLVLVS